MQSQPHRPTAPRTKNILNMHMSLNLLQANDQSVIISYGVSMRCGFSSVYIALRTPVHRVIYPTAMPLRPATPTAPLPVLPSHYTPLAQHCGAAAGPVPCAVGRYKEPGTLAA